MTTENKEQKTSEQRLQEVNEGWLAIIEREMQAAAKRRRAEAEND